MFELPPYSNPQPKKITAHQIVLFTNREHTRKMNMKTLLAALLFLVSGIANAAALQAQAGGDRVTLFTTVCTSTKAMTQLTSLNEKLEENQMPPATKDMLLEAKVFWHGKHYDACWLLVRSTVVIMDDAGLPTSLWALPVQAFREVPEI